MTFMREHGVYKDIYSEREGAGHKTAKGRKTSVCTDKAPGFGPKGILRGSSIKALEQMRRRARS